MNTILPALSKLRHLCLSQLQARGLVRPPKRRKHEVQLEFHWR